MNTATGTNGININGKLTPEPGETVAELLRRQGVDPAARFIAVAVNGQVVRRAAWADTALSPGDAIEIVKPFQGG
ncbi:MAG TPA: sulfur carrier protein ThiS [Stellaceae bacterium]|jgi:sulfur carrier protein|nr:sulfur carrier protein ThiS [Stellaceae bacterium]